jgi:hypothetical protein
MRSVLTRVRGGKEGRPSTALLVKDGFDAALLVTLPEIPDHRAAYSEPFDDLHNACPAIQSQQGSRPVCHTLDQLTITQDLVQVASIISLKSISVWAASSHRIAP